MLTKARLVEIKWDANQQTAESPPGAKSVEVDFNPQTLKLSYANENKGGDQPGGSNKQFVGSGTSKLGVELVFDTTGTGVDVRKRTMDVAYFIQAKAQKDKKNTRVPPGISFEWGSFIFRGVVNSISETLEYFSPEGVPLRATVSLDISRQEIEYMFGKPGQASAGPATSPKAGTPGQAPLDTPRPGESLQQMAARNGNSADWRAIAAANNIDDPLRLSAGALIDVNVSAGVSASAGAGISIGAGASASASAGISIGGGAAAGISGGAAVGFSAGLGGGVGFSSSGGIGAGAGIG
ncbi:MAG TPA: hypothetical protein VFV93_11140, partial [Thermomicrobiales bacterium]|nr:hypothetical protein [Thermomicrobiales bacterium]